MHSTPRSLVPTTVSRTFLVLAYRGEDASLMVRGLKKTFPLCEIVKLNDTSEAFEILRTTQIDAIVLHRAIIGEAVDTIRALRPITKLPIIALSGSYSNALIAAGATQFLSYDEWLLLGPVVANCINISRKGGVF